MMLIAMLENIDPVQVITSVIAILGVVATIVTSLRVRKYIGIVQRFLDIPVQVIKGDADGTRSDEDYIAVGKATYALTDSLNADPNVPVEYKTN